VSPRRSWILLVSAAACAAVVASAVPAYAAEDILALDRTVLVQMALFVATVFLLDSLVFKPLLDLAERRRKLTEGAAQEAGSIDAEAEKLAAEYEARLREAVERFTQDKEEVKRRAQEEARRIVAEAREQARAALGEARREMALEAERLRESLRPQVDTLAREIAARVLGREVER